MIGTLLRRLLQGLLLLLLAGTLLLAHTVYFKPLRIDWFYERVFAEYALQDPELLSSLRMLPAWLDWYSDDLTDASLAHEDRMRRKLKKDLETLRSYDRDALDVDARLSYDMLEYFVSMQVEGDRFRHHDYPLNQLFGAQNELPTFMATQHPVSSSSEAEDYLARLGKFPTKFGQVMEGVRLREQKGIVPPTFVVEKVLAEMRSFVSQPPRENILYTSLAKKIDEAPSGAFDTGEKARLLGEAESVIDGRVYPVYREMIAYYEQLLPKTRGNHGVWALPDGGAYYAWAVRQQTTTDMTPGQVHALGLREVARIEAEMDAILRTEGLGEGSVGTRVGQLGGRPDQLYPDTAEGRARILADYQAIIDEIDAGLDPYFDVRPKMGVKVERVPQFREKTAPGAYYYPPAFDGSRPGIFYVNLRNVAEVQKFAMRTLAYHEAVPGHHFQTTIQQELTGVPTFRKVLPFTAFSEGWALYAERLAWEIGFQEQPLDNLGRLQAEMFRAVRLVVDTGLHDQRWTREQAIAYMSEKTGMPETDVVAEIERYLVLPGQALAYKVGMNRILELRERAQAALGNKFDLRRFHNVVLTGGDMPLTLLERRVDGWIAEQGSG
jgi:uncharacterized protein (DUF885 family)